MFKIEYLGIENPSHYDFSKVALDIIQDEISKSEFAGKVVWDYENDAELEEERLEEIEEWNSERGDWAEAHGAEFGGPFYGKYFQLRDDNGTEIGYFTIFNDDLQYFFTDNEAWYNVVKSALDRINPLHLELYKMSVYYEAS